MVYQNVGNQIVYIFINTTNIWHRLRNRLKNAQKIIKVRLLTDSLLTTYRLISTWINVRKENTPIWNNIGLGMVHNTHGGYQNTCLLRFGHDNHRYVRIELKESARSTRFPSAHKTEKTERGASCSRQQTGHSTRKVSWRCGEVTGDTGSGVFRDQVNQEETKRYRSKSKKPAKYIGFVFLFSTSQPFDNIRDKALNLR